MNTIFYQKLVLEIIPIPFFNLRTHHVLWKIFQGTHSEFKNDPY